jgi:hypothetical protein
MAKFGRQRSSVDAPECTRSAAARNHRRTGIHEQAKTNCGGDSTELPPPHACVPQPSALTAVTVTLPDAVTLGVCVLDAVLLPLELAVRLPDAVMLAVWVEEGVWEGEGVPDELMLAVRLAVPLMVPVAEPEAEAVGLGVAEGCLHTAPMVTAAPATSAKETPAPLPHCSCRPMLPPGATLPRFTYAS